ncbi:MAG: hypothetical protein QM495_02770 [Lutibacter sp.]|uniref:hypothetical protein n=1 Tax=Lutibacter sp. TaxID=1925666 RepID=UPI00385F74C8
MRKKINLIIAVLLVTTTTFSQITKKFIDTGSVKNQFDYLIKKSNRYQQYKVVEINWLSKLKSNVSDSLTTSKNEILANYKTINTQQKAIDSLKTVLNNFQGEIDTLTSEKQSISIFGIQIGKTTFKTIVFSIIAILILLLVVFITKFKQSYGIIKQTKLNLKETEDEFESHRKKALEREQKVRRQLQDELNKHKKD